MEHCVISWKRTFKLSFLLFVFTYPLSTYAKNYSYKSSDGTVCFTDDLGKVPAKLRSKVKVDDEEPTVIVVEEKQAPSKGKNTNVQPTSLRNSPTNSNKRFTGTVILYVRGNCPISQAIENCIKGMGAPYVRKQLPEDDPMFDGVGATRVDVGGKLFDGRDIEQIQRAIRTGG